MHELSTYRIEVRGRIDERDINARSPHRTTLVRTGPRPRTSPSAPTSPA